MVILVTNIFTPLTLRLLTNFQKNHICLTNVYKKSHANYHEIPSNDLLVNCRLQAGQRTQVGSEEQTNRKGGGRAFFPCNPF